MPIKTKTLGFIVSFTKYHNLKGFESTVKYLRPHLLFRPAHVFLRVHLLGIVAEKVDVKAV